MRSRLVLAVASLAVAATLAVAEPTARVVYLDGVPRIELSGNWSGSRYRVARATAPDGAWNELLANDALCTGDCFAVDYGAEPGRTYWYRFELWTPDGATLRYGPYALAISPELAHPIRATVGPNPSSGPATVRLTLAGRPGGAAVESEAALFDLSGRRVATLFRGPLGPGTRAVAWDGRADGGRPLESGRYWLRFRAADGRTATTAVLRVR